MSEHIKCKRKDCFTPAAPEHGSCNLHISEDFNKMRATAQNQMELRYEIQKKYEDLQRKYENAQRRNEDLQKKYEIAQRKNEDLQQKYDNSQTLFGDSHKMIKNLTLSLNKVKQERDEAIEKQHLVKQYAEAGKRKRGLEGEIVDTEKDIKRVAKIDSEMKEGLSKIAENLINNSITRKKLEEEKAEFARRLEDVNKECEALEAKIF